MRFGLIGRRVGRCAVLFGIAGACLSPTGLPGGEAGRKIEISPSRDDASTTNRSEIDLKRVRENFLRRNLKAGPTSVRDVFNPSGFDEMDPLYRPPQPANSAPDRQQRSSRERINQYIFLQLNNPGWQPSVEDLFNLDEIGPDGRRKSQKSELENLSDSLERKDIDKDKEKDKDPRGDAAKDDQTDAFSKKKKETDIFGLRDDSTGGFLRNTSGPGGFRDSLGARDSYSGPSGFSGPGSYLVPFERTPAQKAYLEGFRQLLQPRVQPSTLDSAIGGSTPAFVQTPSPSLPIGMGPSVLSPAAAPSLSSSAFTPAGASPNSSLRSAPPATQPLNPPHILQPITPLPRRFGP